jgi:general secretion pathway protein N
MSVRGNRLLSIVLAGICGCLLLLALILQAGWGRGYRWATPDDSAALAATNIDHETFKLPSEKDYAATDARPLFNEDRKPTPEIPDEPVKPDVPPSTLNIALTGIVLTPQLHLALIMDKSKNSTISLREGMPMPGDQGDWTLTELKPRSAIFKQAPGGEEVEVELTTAVASQKAAAAKPGKPGAPPPPPPPHGSAPAAATATAANGANPGAAEQLQRRIEERRRQMRDEAERMKRQKEATNPGH